MADDDLTGVQRGRLDAASFGGSGTRFRFDEAGLRELFDSPTGLVGKGLVRSTLRIERTAKRLCPVNTGRLRASITHALEKDAQSLVGVVGTNVEYAPHVELGPKTVSEDGSGFHAQPFLRPALASEMTRG